jgi:hypothetical protein
MDITYTYNQSNIGLRDISGTQDPFREIYHRLLFIIKFLLIEILQNFNALGIGSLSNYVLDLYFIYSYIKIRK